MSDRSHGIPQIIVWLYECFIYYLFFDVQVTVHRDVGVLFFSNSFLDYK